jgi:hypothetical protein
MYLKNVWRFTSTFHIGLRLKVVVFMNRDNLTFIWKYALRDWGRPRKLRTVFERFEVFTAVRMSILAVWVVTPCWLVGRYPVDGDSMFLRNAGLYLRVHKASQTQNNNNVKTVVVFGLRAVIRTQDLSYEAAVIQATLPFPVNWWKLGFSIREQFPDS